MVLDFFELLLSSKIFLSAFLGWLSAQGVKTIIGIIVQLKAKYYKLSDAEREEYGLMRDTMTSLLWRTGGMPSSHVAMSSALTVAVGFEEGFASTLFIVTFFFSCIIVRDSTGVRLLTGKLARRVNVLIEHYNLQSFNHKKMDSLKIVEGHTFSEVFVGILLGVFISISIYLF